jgi:hypothetical protein
MSRIMTSLSTTTKVFAGTPETTSERGCRLAFNADMHYFRKQSIGRKDFAHVYHLGHDFTRVKPTPVGNALRGVPSRYAERHDPQAGTPRSLQGLRRDAVCYQFRRTDVKKPEGCKNKSACQRLC